MITANCGFQDNNGLSGSVQLIQKGPTIKVRVGFDPLYKPGSKAQFRQSSQLQPALIDTGAYESCIDTTLADKLNLPFVGTTTFSGISGKSEHNCHLAQIIIPALKVTIYGRFAAVNLKAGGQPHAVLLGRIFLMNYRLLYDGQTGNVRILRQEQIQQEPDIVAPKSERPRNTRINRNEPCPCGSGKKYKNCCALP